MDGAAHLDAADHSVGFHRTGYIYGITPQVVAKLCPTYDTCHDRSSVDSDSALKFVPRSELKRTSSP